MKSRLSGTIWGLIGLNGVALALVIWFAFGAGKQAANGGAMFESSGKINALVIAIVVSNIFAGGARPAVFSPLAEPSSVSLPLAYWNRKGRPDSNPNTPSLFLTEN